MFKLKVGDVVRLDTKIESDYKSYTWNTGLYKVIQIGGNFGSISDRNNPKLQSYTFQKIKKDGTPFKVRQFYGYNAFTFDEEFLTTGLAKLVSE